MIQLYRSVRPVASAIAAAAETAIDAYCKGRVTDEPHITDRMMSAIENHVNGISSPASAAPGRGKKLKWRAMTLRAGSGSAAQERLFGADVMGVLTISTSDFALSKGFLAQAKRAEPGEAFSRSEWERLQGQCEAMLAVTPDSFVLVYSKSNGARFFSAQAVRAYSGQDIFKLYNTGVRTFFERHITSFVGDPRLDCPHINTLERIQRDIDSRQPGYLLSLKAHEVED